METEAEWNVYSVINSFIVDKIFRVFCIVKKCFVLCTFRKQCQTKLCLINQMPKYLLNQDKTYHYIVTCHKIFEQREYFAIIDPGVMCHSCTAVC